MIAGSDKMILWNDLDYSEPIKVYDKGIMISESAENRLKKLVGYRTGDMWAPQVDRTEALLAAARHFVACIQDSTKPITDGECGLRIVRILDAATESLTRHGQEVALVG